MRIAVLGAGAWGTGLAISLSSHSSSHSSSSSSFSHEVILWTRNAAHLAELNAHRINKRYFPAFPLPESLRLTSSLFAAIETADLALVIVPVSGLREILRGIVACRKTVPVIWGCKGFEAESAKLPHQVPVLHRKWRRGSQQP
jgi:glycerol-3-phosphate dehydrogenase (NAD(P)+)